MIFPFSTKNCSLGGGDYNVLSVFYCEITKIPLNVKNTKLKFRGCLDFSLLHE